MAMYNTQQAPVNQNQADIYKREGAQEAIAGLQQQQQVGNAINAAGQQGFNEGHIQGVTTGANEAAKQIVAGLTAGGEQPQEQEQQFDPEAIKQVAQAVASGNMDEPELDQLDAQHPGVKAAVLDMLHTAYAQQEQAQQQQPQGQPVAPGLPA